MYYQIYDTKTGETCMTCSGFLEAKNMCNYLNNPHYFDINEPDYKIRTISKSDHPLKGRMTKDQ